MKEKTYLILTHKLTVNYDRSIVESIEAGKYRFDNKKITDKDFPSKEKGEEEIEIGIFHFGFYIYSQEAIDLMQKEGFRPATMKELLAFGEKYPELRTGLLDDTFFALANNDNNNVGVINKAEVNFYSFKEGWNGYCRFLAVRCK